MLHAEETMEQLYDSHRQTTTNKVNNLVPSLPSRHGISLFAPTPSSVHRWAVLHIKDVATLLKLTVIVTKTYKNIQ